MFSKGRAGSLAFAKHASAGLLRSEAGGRISKNSGGQPALPSAVYQSTLYFPI